MIDCQAFRALRMTHWFAKSDLSFCDMYSYMGYYWNGYHRHSDDLLIDLSMAYSVVNPSRETELLDIGLTYKTTDIAKIWLNQIGVPIDDINLDSLRQAFERLNNVSYAQEYLKDVDKISIPDDWYYIIEGNCGSWHDVRLSRCTVYEEYWGVITIIQRIDNDVSYMFHGTEYDFNYGEYKSPGPPED